MRSSGLLLSTEAMNEIEYTITTPDMDAVKWAFVMDGNFKDAKVEWPALSKIRGREITSTNNFYGGLWTLFHHIVVSSNQDPDIVAETLKDFVSHFILCSTCRNHFLRM